MARPSRTVFTCSECGRSEPRWLGRCPGCDGWSTLVEEVAPSADARASQPRRAAAARRVVPLSEVSLERADRLSTGIPELDRVLGGGLVPGSLVLLGGEPGVGKSTLLLSALAAVSRERRGPRRPRRGAGAAGEGGAGRGRGGGGGGGPPGGGGGGG